MRTIIAGILFLLLTATAFSEAKYEGPNVSEYLESLKQPDSPTASCCGEGDAYWADETEPCPPEARFSNDPYVNQCQLVAIITDTRPNEFEVIDKDGNKKKIYRAKVDPGTKVIITKQKVRKVPSENPTVHNFVFLTTYGYVICWEPTGGI